MGGGVWIVAVATLLAVPQGAAPPPCEAVESRARELEVKLAGASEREAVVHDRYDRELAEARGAALAASQELAVMRAAQRDVRLFAWALAALGLTVGLLGGAAVTLGLRAGWKPAPGAAGRPPIAPPPRPGAGGHA